MGVSRVRDLQRRIAFSQQVQKTQAAQGGHIRPLLFYGMFAVLVTTNILTLVALLMNGDIASLVKGSTDQFQVAYQDRITSLRLEVDRLHSRQYAQAGNLNLQLQELSHQQEVLSEQHNYVKALAEKARELGIDTAAIADMAPIDTTLITGAISTGRNELPDLEYITQSITDMMDESRMALAALSDAARDSADTIVSELDQIGLSPKLPADFSEGVGGPFEPVPGDHDPDSLVSDANAVIAAFERFRVVRHVAAIAPIHKPLAGKVRQSSSFGVRKDPFLNRKAFHSGVDFAAPSGTLVSSAGAGTVSFVGNKSGYGKVVEIQHLGGLTTRYAHLSAFITKVGAKVEAGTPIAKVGSTGRSTGPHLHFEVRKHDKAISPLAYLRAGAQLARFL